DAALKLRQVPEVVPYLERAIAINPSLRDARDILNQIKLRGEGIYSLKYFGQIGTGSELNEEGHRLLDELKLAEATAKFIENIEKHGDSCESYCGLGIVQFYRGEYEDAFRLFSHAIELNPLSEDALLNLYDSACKIDLADKALLALQNAIDIDPSLEKVKRVILEHR
ncbi:MAG: tetratricopeptide repeat protein, partial [Fibrobacteres bacterium]|nr:tetratricopeptide repeat protein [Fibrobacterota bacterium]